MDNEYRDGDRIVQVVSAAESYRSFDTFLQVLDDEVSAILVFPTDGGTVLSEEQGVDGFGVALSSRPQSDVLVSVDLIDWPVGPSDVILDQGQLIFTTADWDVPRTVSLIGIPDLLVEGDEAGSVRLSVDAVNSNGMFSGTSDRVLPVVVLDWQPNMLKVSEDASEVFLVDEVSGVKLLAGSHVEGLNVLANDLPQSIVLDSLSETTGSVRIDLRGGADSVELNGNYFTRIDGGSGIDRLVVNSEMPLELMDYLNGRVFGFEEYVFPLQESAIEVDLNRLDQVAGSGESAIVTLYVASGDQLKILGDGVYASPEMVGGQFAQVIVSAEGRLRIVTQSPWQNVVNQADVNLNGEISVADALAVLNDLSMFGSDLPATPALTDFRGVFPDVSGDGFTTALDALLVLNRIAFVSDAEGETEWLQMSANTSESSKAAGASALELGLCPTSPEQSLLKVASTSHPADQAIVDLYSSPVATDEVASDEVISDGKGQSAWEMLGSNLT